MARRKCIFPNGMPMMVMQKRMPKRRWVIHIHMPPIKNHSTFMNRFRQPGCGSLRLIFEPGENAEFHALQPEGYADDGDHQGKSCQEVFDGDLQSAEDDPDDVS